MILSVFDLDGRRMKVSDLATIRDRMPKHTKYYIQRKGNVNLNKISLDTLLLEFGKYIGEFSIYDDYDGEWDGRPAYIRELWFVVEVPNGTSTN